MDTLIVHYSEIGTKGKNRKKFERQLIGNLENFLGDLVKKVYRRYGIIVCDLSEGFEEEEIKGILGRIPGVANFSFAIKTKLDYKDIEKKSFELLKNKKFKTFRVSSRRSNKSFKMRSKEINETLGGKIASDLKKKVDLKNGELDLRVEIGEKEAFVYTDKFSGVYGLPVGSSGKLICSLSGGLDSPVAAYLMMKRGCEIVFVHIFNKTLSGGAVKDKIGKIVSGLEKIQGSSKIYFVPFEEIQKEIIKHTKSDSRMIIYRRVMMRILNKVSEKEGSRGIVTGDSLGQVASQTIENIEVIRESSEKPVLSPLIGMNKEEIIDIAKKIGTYEASIIPVEDCCSFMIAENPKTKARLKDIEAYEKKIGEKKIEELVRKAVKEAEIL
jgi:tRNA uracil 4-sulfurtransferase